MLDDPSTGARGREEPPGAPRAGLHVLAAGLLIVGLACLALGVGLALGNARQPCIELGDGALIGGCEDPKGSFIAAAALLVAGVTAVAFVIARRVRSRRE